ncbi:MAG: EamA/RhaT family transporter [Thermoleophilia bacterium]|nr:EamA/RhaT family transporter [Thermoleophilia bacterium]
MGQGRIVAAAPALFVVLWASGFVVAREGVSYADPLTLVAIRFSIACVLLLALAVVTRARWPTRREALHSAVVGLFLQAAYVCCVFIALDQGLAAVVTALVVGLQPLLSACVVGPLLNERVRPMQWAGLVIGLAGVALVVARGVEFGSGTELGLLLAVVALVGITAGTVYQRRFCRAIDLRTGTACSFASATVVSIFLAFAIEPMHVRWTWQLFASLAWMSAVLSVGTILLLFWLLRRMEVTRVTSLFYLVPPVAALMAWLWFGETISWVMAGGIALAATGVTLVQKGAG